MSFAVNQCTIGGTLTRRPDLKFMPNGKAVAEFTLAVNESWKTDQGEKREKVSFLDFSIFGKSAEVLTEYTDKGHTILVEARASQESWDDKQTGAKRSKVKFIADRFHFVGKPKGAGNEEYDQTQRAPSRPTRPAAPPRDEDLDPVADDDIPF